MQNKRLVEMPEHPGYFLDTDGNVYSCWINKGLAGLHLSNKPKKLKCSVNKSGHISITFKGGKRAFVHRLMYETFIKEIPNGMIVRHLNDIPGDNRLENLCLGTQKDNMRDCIRNGHHNPNRKFTDKQIKIIKKQRETKTVKELALEYNVNEKTIRNIVNNYYKGETQ